MKVKKEGQVSNTSFFLLILILQAQNQQMADLLSDAQPLKYIFVNS